MADPIDARREDGGNGESEALIRFFDSRINHHSKRLDVLEANTRQHKQRLDSMDTSLGAMLVHVKSGEEASHQAKEAALMAVDAATSIKAELVQIESRWQRFCDERHRHVDVRMSSMSDEFGENTGVHSPPEYLVQRISDLKSQLDSMRPKVDRLDSAERETLASEARAVRATRGRNAAAITLGVTACGVLAEVLRQWLSS
jgi:chromosome segregation ATPase